MIQMLELADKHLKIIIYLVLKNKQEMKNWDEKMGEFHQRIKAL